MKKNISILLFIILIILSGCTYKWFFSLTVDINGEGTVLIDGSDESYIENISKHSSVNLTADASEGWEFNNWSGDIMSTENPLNIEIVEDTEITANFLKKEYSIDINIFGEGEVKEVPEKDLYEYGERVALIAQPKEKWEFLKWTGDLNSNDSIEEITVDSDKNVNAEFVQNKFELDIVSEGRGSIIIEPEKEYYDLNEEVKLTARASDGWNFSNWTGDATGNDNHLTIEMNSDKSMTAIFSEEKYYLTLYSNGDGLISVDPQKEEYEYGEIVELFAVGIPGNVFSMWLGDLSGNSNPVLIRMNGNKTVEGNFEKEEYELSVNVDGSGEITIDPEKDFYYYGDIVNFQAIPEAGWSFVSWDGDATGSENPLSYKIKGDLNLTGIFEEDEYSISIDVFGKGKVVVDPYKDKYHYNDYVNISAQASPGWEFNKWIGDVSSSNDSINLYVDSDLDISVIFLLKSSTPTIEDVHIPEKILSGDTFTIGATITDKENDIEQVFFEFDRKVTPNNTGDYYWYEFTAPSSVSTLTEHIKIEAVDSGENRAELTDSLLVSPNEWLIMIYMAADNNLQNFAWEDILEMSSSEFNDDVKLTVLYDRRSPDFENENIDFSGTRRYQIMPGDVSTYENLGELNTGNVENLKDFVSWSVDRFGGKKKFLVLWDHGDGWYEYDTYFESLKSVDGYICKDISSSDALDMEDLGNFEDWYNVNYGKIDVAAFDACLMQMVEVGYELKNCSDYIISSAAYVPSFGFPYDDIMGLFGESNISPEALCIDMADSFISSSNIDTVISVVESEEYSDLISKIDDFSQKVITADSTELINSVESAAQNSQFYDNSKQNIDLNNFMRNIYGNISYLETEADEIIDALDDLIYYRNGNGEYESSAGVSIWYSDSSQFDEEVENYKKISFAIDSLWDGFLEKLYE